jgi:hypothetical protein
MDYLSALFDAMRTAPEARDSRGDADQVLGGDPVTPGQPGMRRLLAAAAAPAQPGELENEPAAVSALVRAYRESAPPVTVRVAAPRHRGALSRAFAVKLMAASAVLALGGTALAAEVGGLPDPVQQRAHDWFAPLGVPAPVPSDSASHAAQPSPSASPVSSATTDLVLLCRTWVQAREDATHGRAVEPAVRRALIEAAGSENKITGYCAALGVTASPTPSTSEHGASASPSGNGSGNGNGKGKPSAHPSPSVKH